MNTHTATEVKAKHILVGVVEVCLLIPGRFSEIAEKKTWIDPNILDQQEHAN